MDEKPTTTENSEFPLVWTEVIVKCSWAELGTVTCNFEYLKLVQFYAIVYCILGGFVFGGPEFNSSTLCK